MPTLTLTEDTAVYLPGMGMVTGEITYTNGTADTREEPGDPAGIEDVSLKDAFGIDLDPDDILEDAARHAALEEAVWCLLMEQDAQDEAMYEDYLDGKREEAAHVW